MQIFGINILLNGVALHLSRFTPILTLTSLNLSVDNLPPSPSLRSSRSFAVRLFWRFIYAYIYFILRLIFTIFVLRIDALAIVLPQGIHVQCKGLDISTYTDVSLKHIQIKTSVGALHSLYTRTKGNVGHGGGDTILSFLLPNIKLARISLIIDDEMEFLLLRTTGNPTSRIHIARIIILRRRSIIMQQQHAWPLANICGVSLGTHNREGGVSSPLAVAAAESVTIRLPTSNDISAFPPISFMALVTKAIGRGGEGHDDASASDDTIIFTTNLLTLVIAPTICLNLNHITFSSREFIADTFHVTISDAIVMQASRTVNCDPALHITLRHHVLRLGALTIDTRVASFSRSSIINALTSVQEAALCIAAFAAEVKTELQDSYPPLSLHITRIDVIAARGTLFSCAWINGCELTCLTNIVSVTAESVGLKAVMNDSAQALVEARTLKILFTKTTPTSTTTTKTTTTSSTTTTTTTTSSTSTTTTTTTTAAVHDDIEPGRNTLSSWTISVRARGVVVHAGDSRIVNVDSVIIRAARGGGLRGGRLIAHIAAHAVSSEFREENVIALSQAAVAAIDAGHMFARALRSRMPHRRHQRTSPSPDYKNSTIIEDYWWTHERCRDDVIISSSFDSSTSTGRERLSDTADGESYARALEADGIIESYVLTLHVDAVTVKATLKEADTGYVILAAAGVRSQLAQRTWAATTGISTGTVLPHYHHHRHHHHHAENRENEPPLRAEWTKLEIKASRFEVHEAVSFSKGGEDDRSDGDGGGGGGGGVTAITGTRGELRWISTAPLWRTPYPTIFESAIKTTFSSAAVSLSGRGVEGFSSEIDSSGDDGDDNTNVKESQSDEAAMVIVIVRGPVRVLLRGRAIAWAQSAWKAAQTSLRMIGNGNNRNISSGSGGGGGGGGDNWGGSGSGSILLTRVTLGAIRARISVDPEGLDLPHDSSTAFAPFLESTLPVDAARAVGAALRLARFSVTLPRLSGRGISIVLGRSETAYPTSLSAALGNAIAIHVAALGSIRAPEGRELATRTAFGGTASAADSSGESPALGPTAAAILGAAQHVAWAVLPTIVLPVMLPPVLVGAVLVGGVAWGAARAGVRAAVAAEASARESARIENPLNNDQDVLDTRAADEGGFLLV